MRIFARRERPHPGAKLSLFEHEDGYRYQLWVTNCRPPPRAGAGRTPTSTLATAAVRVEDCIRTGKDTGIGRFPSHGYAFNQAWLTAAMIAQILLAWLKLLALDGDLAKAEPKTLRYRVLNAAARLVRGGRRRRWKIAANWPWAKRSPGPGSGSAHCRTPADQHGPVPATRHEPLGARGNPRHPARQPGHRHTQTLKSPLSPRFWRHSAAANNPRE